METAANTLGDPKEIHLRRDGDRDVSFTGWRIGTGELGERGKSYTDSFRGTDVAIFLTVGDQYLASVHQWTRWQGEAGLRRVLGPTEDPEELLALLIEDAGGELGQASKQAWGAACEAYPPLGEHQTEQID